MATLATINVSIGRGNQVLYRGLSLNFAAHERWGILGPNGCGKSTLLLTLSGRIPPLAGDILLNKRALTRYTPRERAKQMAFLSQELHSSFPQTVYDYLASARYPYHHPLAVTRLDTREKELIDATIKRFDLTHLVLSNIQALSGGEKRRVAIAAGCVQDTAIYLLDEPLNHLDLQHQMLTLDALQQKPLSMMALHDINIAEQHVTHIVMLFPSGQFKIGTKADMLTEKNISLLYGLAMEKIHTQDATFWLPKRTNVTRYDIKVATLPQTQKESA